MTSILVDTSIHNGSYICNVYLDDTKTDGIPRYKINYISGDDNYLSNGSVYNNLVDWYNQKSKKNEYKKVQDYINVNEIECSSYNLYQYSDENCLDYEIVPDSETGKNILTYRNNNKLNRKNLVEIDLDPTNKNDLLVHYGDKIFTLYVSGGPKHVNMSVVTLPKGMTCGDFSSQNNCNFSSSNKPKKLKLSPQPQPTPQPTPQPSPQPTPQPTPKPPQPPLSINVDPNIYPITQLNANVNFGNYPKDGKFFYIIDYDGQVADILVADKKQLENSFSILKQINFYHKMYVKAGTDKTLQNQANQMLEDFLTKKNLFPQTVNIKPDKKGNISLAKNPKEYIEDVKSNDIIVYKNGELKITNPDNFNQLLQLTKSGSNYIIEQPPSKKEKSTGMSKNELYAIIFGSIGGVLLIVLIIYFDLQMSKKKSQKRKK